jgi:two-component system copper resistance phosphate regulon response regulator CusR
LPPAVAGRASTDHIPPTEPMRLLLVEDSQRLRDGLHAALVGAGFEVDAAADGAAALAYLDAYDYPLLLLDLGLPKVDGLQVLARLRGCGKPTRVLVLSARDQVTDRVQALDAGADDYLVKPFALDELIARLHALGRRYHGETTPRLAAGNLELDTARRVARCAGQALPLSPREIALLETLLHGRGRVLSRAALFERVYGADARASDKVIEVLLSGLRAKLAAAGWDGQIENRRGFGYVLG